MLRSSNGLSDSALPGDATELELRCCMCGSAAAESTLLLDCLHCCCASCAASTSAAGGDSRPVDGITGLLTCPSCQELTRVSSELGLAAEALAAQPSTVLSSPIVGFSQCAFCLDDGVVRESEHWCSDCARSLCRSCLVFHNKYNRQHVAVTLSSAAANGARLLLDADVSSTARRHCARHPPHNELFCLTCGALRCVACPEGSACVQVRHDLGSVNDPRVADRIAFILEDARLAEAALVKEQAALRPLLHRIAAADNDDSDLLAALDNALHRDQAVLQANKARLLGVVDIAYSRASKALDRCYGSVKAKLCESAKSARLLQRKLEHSVAFGQAVLNACKASPAGEAGGSSGSPSYRSGLLPHLRCLSQRLRALTVECRSTTTTSASTTSLLGSSTAVDNLVNSPVVDLCSHWPAELDDVVSRSIGMPQLSASLLGLQVDGIPSATDVEQQQPPPDGKLDAETCDSLGSCYSSGSLSSISRAAIDDRTSNAGDDSGSNVAPPSLLSLDPDCAPSTFRTEYKCWDMALVGKGTVMVAAYGDGLREYSADGQELSFWLPPPVPKRGRSAGSRTGDRAAADPDSSNVDSVYSVDVTSDDRVVVALLRSRALVALCRSGKAQSPDEHSANPVRSGGWSEDCRIALPFHPWRLASHGSNLVAVAYARSERRKFAPGPSFELFSLSDGVSLLRRTLQYNVVAVALTSGSVVVASERQQLSTDPHSRWTLVDAYSRDGGTLLWRHECNDSIFDIAAEPDTTGHRVYLALSDSRRVIAITGEDDGSGGGGDVVVATVCDAPVRLSLCRAGPLSALAVLLFDLRSICLYT